MHLVYTFSIVNSLLVKTDILLSPNRLMKIHKVKILHCWLCTSGFKKYFLKDCKVFNVVPLQCLLVHSFYFLVYQMKTSSGSETTAPSIFIKAMNFVKWDAASWGRMKGGCPFTNVVSLWKEVSKRVLMLPL